MRKYSQWFSILFLYGSFEAPLIQNFFRDPDCEAGKHHIIFLLYYFCCSRQILLSRSRDRCFFVFPFLSNDEKTEFFWQPLLSTFFQPCSHLSSLRCATIHVYYPHGWCPSPAQSFSVAWEMRRMCLMRSMEQCETLLSVKLMPLCSPEQSLYFLSKVIFELSQVSSLICISTWECVNAELHRTLRRIRTLGIHKAQHQSLLQYMFVKYMG